jgi:hypothetical protein
LRISLSNVAEVEQQVAGIQERLLGETPERVEATRDPLVWPVRRERCHRLQAQRQHVDLLSDAVMDLTGQAPPLLFDGALCGAGALLQVLDLRRPRRLSRDRALPPVALDPHDEVGDQDRRRHRRQAEDEHALVAGAAGLEVVVRRQAHAEIGDGADEREEDAPTSGKDDADRQQRRTKLSLTKPSTSAIAIVMPVAS